MSISPIKINAWSQGLYEVSATKKECLGALRETEDGRKFRYAKSGATLIVGGATYSAAATATTLPRSSPAARPTPPGI